MNIVKRPRRLRTNSVIRDFVRETTLNMNDLMYPLFVVEGENIKKEISSLKGQYQFSIDKLEEEIKELVSLGIKSVILFGIPNIKDEVGCGAYDDNGIIQKAIREIKNKFKDMYIVTDLCMCEYTSHGHCGILDQDGYVNNDKTLKYLAKIAVSQAKAGADMIAPSDMMDGRIAAIREALDKEGFCNIPIMSYSAKYASAFYGPFRDAADSAPSFGDRKSYQMDPANVNEGIRETQLDIEEGADIVMVKPALPYLDVLRKVKDTFNMPIAAYNVSGEYAMIRNAVDAGLLDESAILESLISIKRAGADIIITYFAKDAARMLRG
ncbi:porphobilinogen synthase [Clostridium botulinum C]|uniref:Delta-aminolevulinic acid dehydratase n=3 Tax=Clostridium botulinum TaxID=1491 RepID=A0A9Q4TM39_CLOBO|nr:MULTISPECIES: porphobilinogen synthase [Clostridium]AYF54345.1 porphobilinogen synthase [Clostridium novyi]EES92436.1 porphobilinogen synthase [Clostridium botulinum D str. 1873]MBO3442504.1 porphobilinogen synthase [Clostridium haemolyticum]MCD3196161.1 porphobilinogen synthase [Clostridium botulinum C]MCD3201510.1 porphobilinogen synthase [Clostridium botulinum C]